MSRRRSRGRRVRDFRRRNGYAVQEDQPRKRLALAREFLRWIVTTVVAVAAAVLVVYFAGFRVVVSNTGMEPGLSEGETVLVLQTAYQLRSPQRNDVVAYYPGGSRDVAPSVGRIAALSGETVTVTGSTVLINGTPEAGQDSAGEDEEQRTGSGTIALGNDEYYILNDNRDSSSDSRDPSIGPVREDALIGKVWLALPGAGKRLHLVR